MQAQCSRSRAATRRDLDPADQHGWAYRVERGLSYLSGINHVQSQRRYTGEGQQSMRWPQLGGAHSADRQVAGAYQHADYRQVDGRRDQWCDEPGTSRRSARSSTLPNPKENARATTTAAIGVTERRVMSRSVRGRTDWPTSWGNRGSGHGWRTSLRRSITNGTRASMTSGFLVKRVLPERAGRCG